MVKKKDYYGNDGHLIKVDEKVDNVIEVKN